jgi:hypothetical protein
MGECKGWEPVPCPEWQGPMWQPYGFHEHAKPPLEFAGCQSELVGQNACTQRRHSDTLLKDMHTSLFCLMPSWVEAGEAPQDHAVLLPLGPFSGFLYFWFHLRARSATHHLAQNFQRGLAGRSQPTNVGGNNGGMALGWPCRGTGTQKGRNAPEH